jgi:hypothetical protein
MDEVKKDLQSDTIENREVEKTPAEEYATPQNQTSISLN